MRKTKKYSPRHLQFKNFIVFEKPSEIHAHVIDCAQRTCKTYTYRHGTFCIGSAAIGKPLSANGSQRKVIFVARAKAGWRGVLHPSAPIMDGEDEGKACVEQIQAPPHVISTSSSHTSHITH